MIYREDLGDTLRKDMSENSNSKQMDKSPFLIGVIFTLLGGSLWGFSGTSVQYLTTEGGATPALVTFMRRRYSLCFYQCNKTQCFVIDDPI